MSLTESHLNGNGLIPQHLTPELQQTPEESLLFSKQYNVQTIYLQGGP